MRQYCRYCGSCFDCDEGYYCNERNKLMTEEQIKRVNHCPYFGYTDVGDVINPGQQYQPRQPYRNRSMTPKAKQYSIFDEGGETE